MDECIVDTAFEYIVGVANVPLEALVGVLVGVKLRLGCHWTDERRQVYVVREW